VNKTRMDIARLEWWHARWERQNRRYVEYPTFHLSPDNATLLEIMERDIAHEDLLVLMEMIGFCQHFVKELSVKVAEESNRSKSVLARMERHALLPMYAATKLRDMDEDLESGVEYMLRDAIELVFEDWILSNRIAEAVVDGKSARDAHMNSSAWDYWSPWQQRNEVEAWTNKKCNCKIKLKELREAVE
jgi:hypothetical protein